MSGFIDAEGNFQVFLDRNYLRVMFRIRLHIDDINVLYKIKKFLGVGSVKIDKTSCLFIITNKKDLNAKNLFKLNILGLTLSLLHKIF